MRFVFAVFVALSLMLSGCNQATKCEKEVYLIPSGFQGRIMIFFNQPDGQEVAYEGDARLYKIPSGGLMKSKFPKNGGCMNDHRLAFYYLDSLGNRKPLLYFLDMARKEIPPDSNYVVFSLLSDKGSRNAFVIHLVGSALEFEELTRNVNKQKPEEILKSLK